MPARHRFKDHFSERSGHYARHRPQYPDDLFRFLASCCRGHGIAWDCATGNGQAAIALSRYFSEVIATDASAAQIGAAIVHPGVAYRIAAAEDSGLEDAGVDLITVGQALHWFDTDRFFAEAERVLVPGGVLAAWCYELCQVSKECDLVIDELYTDIVGAFWPPERRLIEARYAPIELPGERIVTPRFNMAVEWHAADMLGYLKTWSACNRYRKEHDRDPVSIIESALCRAWGTGSRLVSWPLTLLACRVG